MSQWISRAACWLVGAGFIGAEVATAARDRGLDVTVVEALSVPYEGRSGRCSVASWAVWRAAMV